APAALAVDSMGNLFIADPGWDFFTGDAGYQACCDYRIRKISPAGVITTVAGSGRIGFSGDGGPAGTAALNGPVGVAVDANDNVYVADSYSGAVRVLHPANSAALIGSVVDAASQRSAPVSPGEIVVIYGAGLGPLQLTEDGNAGTKVFFDG